MQVGIQNVSPSEITVQGQTIAASDLYEIPTADLLTWAKDLSVRCQVMVNNLVVVIIGTQLAYQDGDRILEHIAEGFVGTS